MLSIILSRRDFREYDQIISLYTKDRGKLELLSRGVKKITSKNAAHLEPFSFVFAEMVPGKEIDHLITVQPVNTFKHIRSDLDKSFAAGYVASLSDRLLQAGESDVRIFDLLKSWLEFVEKTKKMHELLVDGYVVKLLSLLGFEPILHTCVLCEKQHKQIMKDRIKNAGLPGAAMRSPGLYFAGGGLLCADCREQRQRIGEDVKVCGLKEVSDMTVLLDKDWHRVYDFPLKTDDRKRLHDLVYAYAVYHSEKKIVDWGRNSNI